MYISYLIRIPVIHTKLLYIITCKLFVFKYLLTFFCFTQALHYLQNVCNHPKLVLVPEHPEAMRVARQLAQQGSSLDDIEHGAKLPALK